MAQKGNFPSLLLRLLPFLVFFIPFEHKYDKLFRHVSLTLLPAHLSLPEGFEKKIYFYPSDLLALFLFCLALFALRLLPQYLWKERKIWCLSLIFLCALGSLFNSPLALYPVPYFRLFELFTPFVFFALILWSFDRETSKRLATAILWALVCSALLESSIAIAQYFRQTTLGLRLIGEPPFHLALSTTPRIEIPGGHRWLFDHLSGRIAPLSFILRAPGTFASPNVLGGFLCLSLLATYFLTLATEKKWLRFTLNSSIPIQFFSLSITYSRSALFAFLLGTILWFGLMWDQKKDTDLKKKIRSLGLTVVISIGLSFSLLYEQYFWRGGVFTYNHLTQKADQSRLFYQNLSLQMIKKHPWLGVGYFQFSYRSPEFLPEDTPPHRFRSGVHNIYLLLSAETGLISLTAFLLFLWELLRAAVRAEKTPLLITFLSLFIALLFIGLCDFYPLLFHQGRLLFFLTAALLSCLSYQKSPQASKVDLERPELQPL